MDIVWVSKKTKISEMEITDEFYMVGAEEMGGEIAKKLKKLGEGGVILVEENEKEVIGYITKNELVNVLAAGENPLEQYADELMVEDFMEVVEDETLGNVLPLIAERYPNAIVVIDYGGKCVGFFSKNDYKDALACLGVYDKSHEPETPDEWKVQGIAMSSMGRTRQAVECYEKALALVIDKEGGWFKMARGFESMGRLKDAALCYERVCAANPNNEDAWLNRGNIYSMLRKNKQAIKCFSRALELKPDSPKVIINMGLVYSDLGMFEKAIACYTKVESIAGENPDIYFKKGNAYDMAGDLKKAVKFYEKALKFNPNIEDAWFNCGAAYHSLNKGKKAIHCFEEVLRINPSNESAVEALMVCNENKGFGLF